MRPQGGWLPPAELENTASACGALSDGASQLSVYGRAAGRADGAAPCRKAGRITSQRRCHKAENRCCLCLLRLIPREKTALRRGMAVQGVPKQEELLQPAAQPSGRAGACPQSLRLSEKAARLCTQPPFDGAAALPGSCFASRPVISGADACRTAAFSFSSLQKSRNHLFCAPARNTRRAHRRTARPWQGAGGHSRQ